MGFLQVWKGRKAGQSFPALPALPPAGSHRTLWIAGTLYGQLPTGPGTHDSTCRVLPCPGPCRSVTDICGINLSSSSQGPRDPRLERQGGVPRQAPVLHAVLQPEGPLVPEQRAQPWRPLPHPTAAANSALSLLGGARAPPVPTTPPAPQDTRQLPRASSRYFLLQPAVQVLGRGTSLHPATVDFGLSRQVHR